MYRRLKSLRLTTLGVGAANSPRFQPAGLLLESPEARIMLDGGPGAEPGGQVDAWLLTDEHAELVGAIRRLARARNVVPRVTSFERGRLRVTPRPVIHTNHPTWGYLISWGTQRVVWAPEFLQFPRWATAVQLMFAEAAGWNRAIRFRGGVGGHLDALSVARAAKSRGVARLVFAHIGRPTIRAMDRGCKAPFGQFGKDGQVFVIRELRSGG